jgi:peptidoglycan hydrolase-like protein with peptidoglycan-binding domain
VATDSRVRSLQKSAGLAVDGKAGPLTWAALEKSGAIR